MKNIATLVLMLNLFPAAGVGQDPVQEQGRLQTKRFWDRELDSIWSSLSPQMKSLFGGPEGLQAFRKQAGDQLGAERELIDEKTQQTSGVRIYSRISRFEKVGQPILTQWAFDDAGAIVQFGIQPVPKAADSPHLDYLTQADFRWPIEEEGYVFWGGRELEQNYHAATSDQRFAYDIVMRRQGLTHQGDGKRNEDYYCFGKKILAPADGQVVAASDGVEDNIPGVMNRRRPLGNHVIIDHGNDEFSFLAHLAQGSVAVKEGDQVKSGDPLGLCGNSGNSSEPHLHYHLQNSPKFLDGQGLPVQFRSYEADGRLVEKGEPVRGQTIRRRD